MAVCIISNVNDVHAVYVELGLAQKGEAVTTWQWGDFPIQSQLAYEMLEDGSVHLPIVNYALRETSLWIHRGLRPTVPIDLHPADRPFAETEAREFLEGLLQEFAASAFCVNPPNAVRRLRSKMGQMGLAVKTGFRIPPSLFSNNPEDIRRFYHKNDGAVVVKYARQTVWTSSTSNSAYIPYTARVKLEDLQNDRQLSACPAIFQREIRKSFELRIVFFGKEVFSFCIDSQASKDSVDWRKDYASVPPCSVFTLPSQEQKKIEAFVVSSGLRYGSIDLVVDTEGNYVFLEVNETGQFLWLEQLLPHVPLLDCFCSFLIAREDGFRYAPHGRIVHCSDFKEQITVDALRERLVGHTEVSPSAVLVED